MSQSPQKSLTSPSATDRKASPRARLVSAGRKLFFLHGVASVSTDMLAREARTSKAALYRHFENASEILVEVLTNESKRFEAGVPLACETREEFFDAMIEYGTRLMRFLNDPEVIRFSQLIHEEARAYPVVAQTFFDAAYGAAHQNLTRMIGYGIDAGYLDVEMSPAETAEQLMGMWEPLRWTKALLGLSRRPYPRPADWAAKCVDALFQTTRDRAGPA